MGRPDFQQLRVYVLSEEIADRIWKIVRGWPILAKDTVGKQLIRCADSIGANIAEGSGRGSFQDNKRFVKIARGSLYETLHFLRRAHQRDLVSAQETAELKSLVAELSPKLNAYLNSIGPQPASVKSRRRTTDNGQRTMDNGLR